MNKTFIKQWMSGLHSLNKTEGICAFPNKYVHVTTNNCDICPIHQYRQYFDNSFELIMLNLIKHISCAQRIWHQVTQRTVFSAYPGGRVPPHSIRWWPLERVCLHPAVCGTTLMNHWEQSLSLTDIMQIQFEEKNN